ncbi:hypothetical protein B7494_g5043 [Chlorociboria aeruginascens]|nr:hypothetical protein B7494_g5043 [Chlorociboria aeruginascens]
MSYRVEVAVTGRAVCKASECKKAGIKIDKDTLRLGSWIVINEHGSWSWKHWGCVTGKQLQNLRTYLEGDDAVGSGVYRWDFLDGLEDEGKGSLIGHPDLQEKVRRCITQGFIDPEDFNGDPEMNKLGEAGLRTKESKRKMNEEKKARDLEVQELQEELAAATAERDAVKGAGGSAKEDVLSARIGEFRQQIEDLLSGKTTATPKEKPVPKGKKHGRGTDGSEEEFEEEKKPLKKRSKKAKKDEDLDEVMPAKKSRGKKSVKQEQDDEMADAPETIASKKRPRGKKAVKEEDVSIKEEDEEASIAPIASKKRGKRAIKEEDSKIANEDVKAAAPAAPAPPRRAQGKKATKEQQTKGNDIEEPSQPADSKAPAKKSRKQAGKQEPAGTDIKAESSTAPANKQSQATDVTGADETFISGIKDDDLVAEHTSLVDSGYDLDFDAFVAQKKALASESKPKKKGGRPIKQKS